MDLSGHWTNEDGRKIFASTLAYARSQGFDQLVLAGLSNGGAGACVLSAEYEDRFRGAVIISGVQGAGPKSLPMLIIHGDSDPLASFANAKKFAARKHRTLVALKGSHFAFLYKREEAKEQLSFFLARVFSD